MKRAAGLLLALAALPASSVPAWLPVPGAPDLAIESASVDARGSLVSVTARGAPSLLLKGHGVSAPPTGSGWHRAALRLQFDCARQRVRTLGVAGYDATGQVVHTSTLPSDAIGLPSERVVEALYDASCELGRALN